MVTLPEYIPEAVAAEYAEMQAEYPGDKLTHRLIFAPAMQTIYETLAGKITTPRNWRHFFIVCGLAASTAKAYKPLIKPARKGFEKHRLAAIQAGIQLRGALLEITEGFHGYEVPRELMFLAYLSGSAAAAKGYSEEAAKALTEPLHADLDSLIRGAAGPAPLEFSDLLSTLVQCLENWQPKTPDGQGQGTAPGPVFVRAFDAHLAHFGMDSLALLTEEQTADLTRVALGMSDEFDAAGNRFNAANVREARKYDPTRLREKRGPLQVQE